MSDFICPFCKKTLIKEEKCYKCESGHSFDIASEGYVHLLPVNKMHSKIPGDTKEMVMSRRRFLEKGYYDCFCDALKSIAFHFTPENGCIIDAGCGEGYYTKRISAVLKRKNCRVSGFDISKYAVRYASKADKGTEYAVASIFDIPVKDNTADTVVNVFAPIVEAEFLRIIKKGGFLIIAVPSPEHLWGLKALAYDEPYKNEKKDTEYSGFDFIERIPVRDSIVISDSALIDDLFTMTPYYWKTSVEGSHRVKQCDYLETPIGFDFLVYRKK